MCSAEISTSYQVTSTIMSEFGAATATVILRDKEMDNKSMYYQIKINKITPPED